VWASRLEDLLSDGVVAPHVFAQRVVPAFGVVLHWGNPVESAVDAGRDAAARVRRAGRAAHDGVVDVPQALPVWLCRKVAFSRENSKTVSWKINGLRVATFLFSVICDRAVMSPGDTTTYVNGDGAAEIYKAALAAPPVCPHLHGVEGNPFTARRQRRVRPSPCAALPLSSC
jgi:hypothetical protein